MKRLRFHGFDCTLAVAARRILLCPETVTAQEFFEQVWRPTDKFLAAFDRVKLKRVTCFAGSPWQFPPGSRGQCANVYVVSAQRQVAYLGTVFDRQAEADDRKRLLERLDQDDPDQAALLRQHGARTIIREHRFCRIPSAANQLTPSALTKAVRNFFRQRTPALAAQPIVWLPQHSGDQLDRWIAGAADRTARKRGGPARSSPPGQPWGY